ncbi:MAG: alkaline phosphatase family protein [Deltaproteobacteria bacterium]|nr:alkaline phosphatase family protein [Deltaproteobacteria bacterium]
MKKRTVLIGLDGATFAILDPFINAGIMPFLKEFVASGVSAELLSVIPPLTPPAWTSLVTGRSPGHHGIFDFFLKEEKNQHIRIATSQDVLCETIWSIASQHGQRVTALNFPLMLPPPAINGNVLSGGWMTWRQLRLGCYPDDLYDRLKALPGFNPCELAMDMAHEERAIEGCRHEEYEDWIKLHIRREQQWFNVLKYLMREDPCELTAILFDGIDKIQHLCWRFLAPDHVNEILSPWEQRIRNLCMEYFSKLDQLLAEIAELAGPDSTFVLASDHGFGAQKATFFVNTWLERNGHLAWANNAPPKESASAVLGMGQLARHVYLLNWEKTVAYAATPSSNGIHIVVAGSGNERGIPEANYESLRNKLIKSLYSLVNPATGEHVVAHVWTREEAFDGPYMHLAPDLTLSLKDGGFVSILASDLPVKLRSKPAGTHLPEGVILARGPGIRKGIALPQLSILDVAPLLLYTLGLTIPRDMEGRMPEEVFEPSVLRLRPVRAGEPSEPVRPVEREGTDKVVFDADAEAEFAARLRALGYME